MPEHTIRGKKKPPGADRRAWVRYECKGDIAFQPLVERKAGTWRPAQVGNISAKGIGLTLKAPLERGSILSVKLEGAAKRFSQPLLVRVVRSVQRSGGVWHLGCTFAIPLGEEELRALLRLDNAVQTARENKKRDRPEDKSPPPTHDPFLHGSASERRTYHRRRVATSIVVAYGTAFEKTQEGLAIDASIGGLKLLTREPLGRGTILRVRNVKAPHSVPSVEVRVKSCRPQQSMWVVGTQFLHTPPSDVMLHFG